MAIFDFKKEYKELYRGETKPTLVTVPPLEGLWWFDEEHFSGEVITREDEFKWVMMLRQPKCVTEDVIGDAKAILAKKKPDLDLSIAASGYQTVMSGFRQHHEIYLSDPNRTSPDKLKTLIKHPIEARELSEKLK